MAENPGIAGDPKRQLAGIRAYIDPERGLVFVKNEQRDEWMLCCPHCSVVYWYKLGESMDHVPIECRRAMHPEAYCPGCGERIPYDRPWTDHKDCRKVTQEAGGG